MFRRAAVVMIVGLACGCGSRGSRRTAAPPPLVIYNTHLVGDPAPPKPKPQVKLIKPGRPPRRLLRYHPAVGTRQQIAMTYVSSTRAGILGSRRTPPAHTRVAVHVVKRHPDGSFDCAIEIEHGESTSGSSFLSTAALKKADAQLRGRRLRLTVAPNGSFPSKIPPLSHKDSDSTRMALTIVWAQVLGLKVLLPDQPVGAGARWRVIGGTGPGGSSLGSASVDVSLVSMRGDELQLSMTTTNHVRPHRASADPLVVLEKYDGKGTATATVDLSRPLPLTLHQSIKMAIEQSLWSAPGGRMHMSMQQSLELTMESK